VFVVDRSELIGKKLKPARNAEGQIRNTADEINPNGESTWIK